MQSANARTLGNFVVEDSMGRGGMGELLVGHQPALNRPVVLKTLRRDFVDQPEYVERFHREACLAASVHHQNVVAVYDCFSHRGNHYIALEYVDGLDLRTILQRSGPLPPRICALIALECARGLEAIHVRGMVHRDIKPANILIGREGETKIADFGIALDPSASPLTQTGHALGSPPYMSPEQYQGERVDARADVFALGTVLYELLSGRPPYKRSNSEEEDTMLAKMTRERYVPLRKSAPGTPRYLRGLVRQCLRSKTKRRLGSMSDLRAQLERRLGRPTTADAREEIGSFLWDLGLFQIREGETVIARVSRRRPHGRFGRMRWIAGGFVTAALLGCLATVMFQQRVILHELASTLPADFRAPNAVISALENASAQLRKNNATGTVPATEDTAPPLPAPATPAAADSVVDATAAADSTLRSNVTPFERRRRQRIER